MTDDTILDLAHERINALGGRATSQYDTAYNKAVMHALVVLEDLGGQDPLELRCEIRELKDKIRAWIDMTENCAGVPNNPDSLPRMLLHEMRAAIGEDRAVAEAARRGRDEAAA